MLAFSVKPTPFHFGLLLNIANHCGLGSPKSMQDLLFPLQPEQYLIDEEEKTNEERIPRGPSFLSSINSYDNDILQIDMTNNENQELVTNSSSELIEQQDNITTSELSSEWWQDPDDVRKGSLLTNHLQPFSNASILKPNISYKQPNLVDLRMPQTPAERLMLLGGIPGVLKHMQESNVLPNNIIFNTLLHVNKSFNSKINFFYSNLAYSIGD